MMELRRTRFCAICNKQTAQKLSPNRDGATWRCVDGDHDGDHYTQQQMYAALEKVAAKLPPSPRIVAPATRGVRVFVESHSGAESELDAQFVRMHAETTGELPVVGKPLSRRVGSLPAPFNIITYGKVVRIECPNPSPKKH